MFRWRGSINQTLAASALAMLKIAHHGGFFNVRAGQMCALPVDPELWRRVKRRTKLERSKK